MEGQDVEARGVEGAPGTDAGPRSAYSRAVRQLSAHQKTSKGAPAYSRFVNRPLGRRAAAGAFVAGLTPNQVTCASAAFTFAGIALLALVRPTPGTAVAVALLLVTGYALDSADGQLARLRGGGSPAGEWLDHVIDAAKTAALHAAVLVAFYRYFSLPTALLLLPLLYLVTATTWFFTVVLTDQLRRARQSAPSPAAGPPRRSTLRALLALPTDYGLLCLLFGLFAQRYVFVWAYGAMLAGTLLFFCAALVSWFRELNLPAHGPVA